MPRFTFTALEEALLGQALVREARTRGLSDHAALVAAANTTLIELRALVQVQLTTMRAESVAILAAADAANASRKSALTAEIAALDSALAKL